MSEQKQKRKVFKRLKMLAEKYLEPYPVLLKIYVKDDLKNDNVALTKFFKESGEIQVLFSLKYDFEKVLRHTAVHEAVHVVQFLTEYIGGELDNESEAYLVEAVTKWFWDILFEKENKKI